MVETRKDIERNEAWMRILVLIISGIILYLWKALVIFVFLVHWFIVIFTGKRDRRIAEFNEIWNTQIYDFFQYMNFMTNERPFPFNPLKKNITKFSK